MPDGVSYIRVDGSDSAKQAFLQANPIVVSSAPAPSADVLVTPSPALSSSVASFHYTLSHPAFAPEAIPSTIVPQTSITDDGTIVDVPLGFDFNFYGNTYNKLNIYSNGFVTFGTAVKDPTGLGFFRGDLIPYPSNPNNMIAFAWTDWSPQRVVGGIRFETRGTAPNRRFLLQFNNVPEFSGRGLLLMQLVLTEGANDITIYTNTMSITASSDRVTQGIENADGTLAAFDSVQNPVNLIWSPRVRGFFKLTNDAVRFSPPRPPVVTPPANLSVNTAPPTSGEISSLTNAAVGSCAAVVDPGVGTATDDAPGVTVAGKRSDGLALDAPYPRGVTTITWTATDVDGMTATANQTITVNDKENPSIVAPGDISTGNDLDMPSAVVSVGTAQAADNCPNVQVSSSRSDGATLAAPFMVGLTTVTWTATDASGNTASAKQSVTVRDIQPPTLSVNNLMVNATSRSGAVVNYTYTATDNVGVTSVVCSKLSGSIFPIGETTVTCTAFDAAGNTVSESFVVQVLNAQAQMENLIQYILSLGLPEGTTNPLVNQVRASYGDNSVDQECKKMSDFISMVSKKGRDITLGASSYMTNEAGRIMNVLGCSNAPARTRLLNPVVFGN